MSRRFLLLTFNLPGQIQPFAPLAAALRRRGHEVGWATVFAPPLDLVRASGATPLRLPEYPQVERVPMGKHDRAWDWNDIDAQVAFWRRRLEYWPRSAAVLRALIRDYRPDAVALDCRAYGAILACAQEGIPYAGVCCGLRLIRAPMPDCTVTRVAARLREPLLALFHDHGVDAELCHAEVVSPHTNLMFATRALLGPDAQLAPRTHLVGPSIDLARAEPALPWSRVREDLPLVYVSFGTVYWAPAQAEMLVRALRAHDVQIVISGRDLPPALARHPNTICVDSAPQLAILRRASLFITHGGANSVMEAMYFGVPLLVCPGGNDQPIQAMYVERRGVGLGMQVATASEATIAEAIAALMQDSGYRDRAAQVARSYQSTDGAAEAAHHLVSIAA